MGVMDRVRRMLAPAPETRRGGEGIGSLGLGGLGNSVSAVNPHRAENLVCIFACVQAIASAIATLRPYVYLQTDNGRREAPSHPVSRLTRRPNARQTWPDFLEMIVAQTLLYGNGLAVIEYDGAGRVTALVPVPWSNVLVGLLPDGRLYYDVIFYTAPWGGTGQPRRYFSDEVLHLKDRSDDTFLGRSRLSRVPEMLGAALSLQQFTSSVWENQATPSGALKTDGTLSPEAAARLADSFARSAAGPQNARRTILLEQGLSWEPFGSTNEDAELLESRKYSTEELCRLFGVPCQIVQDLSNNTFNTASQAGLWFAQLTLLPWIRKIECEFDRSVFGEGNDYSLELDVSSMMRGDFSSRWSSYIAAVQAGILDASEVREMEGFGPRPQPTGEAPPDPP